MSALNPLNTILCERCEGTGSIESWREGVMEPCPACEEAKRLDALVSGARASKGRRVAEVLKAGSRYERILHAQSRVLVAADEWEADQGDCFDLEIALAKAVRAFRKARLS